MDPHKDGKTNGVGIDSRNKKVERSCDGHDPEPERHGYLVITDGPCPEEKHPEKSGSYGYRKGYGFKPYKDKHGVINIDIRNKETR
jgi:hypothetical protein